MRVGNASALERLSHDLVRVSRRHRLPETTVSESCVPRIGNSFRKVADQRHKKRRSCSRSSPPSPVAFERQKRRRFSIPEKRRRRLFIIETLDPGIPETLDPGIPDTLDPGIPETLDPCNDNTRHPQRSGVFQS